MKTMDKKCGFGFYTNNKKPKVKKIPDKIEIMMDFHIWGLPIE